MKYLNYECLDGISQEEFRARQPYPWVNTPGTLTPQGFAQLRETLPDVSLFDRQVGMKRAHGQASHDRAILHYRPNLTPAEPWRAFISELQGKDYDAFLRRMLGIPAKKRLVLTMEWYYAWEGCAVSPHCDARRKMATHIFYFNTKEDWDGSWGGNILIMDGEGRYTAHSGPTFDDLKVAASVDPRENGSLFFQRTEHSWHGVRPLQCPPDNLRKLFLITINKRNLQVWFRRIKGQDPDGYRLRTK